MSRVISIHNAPASRKSDAGMADHLALPVAEPTEQTADKSASKPLPKRKPSKPRSPKVAVKTRASLSFTAQTKLADREHPSFTNWLPPVIPPQINQWNKGRDLGLNMVEEIALLAQENEVEAFHAMRFACNEPSWRVGGNGIESGFSEGIAALAIVGLRYLARGAAPFDEEHPQNSAPWSAQELIDKRLKEVASAPGPLVELRGNWAMCAIGEFLNVGLIDGETYTKMNRQLAAIIEKRTALQQPAQE